MRSSPPRFPGASSTKAAPSSPHVEVVIVDLATGRERKTETSDRGEFVLPGLAPARYQLTAQRDGFAPLQVPDIDAPRERRDRAAPEAEGLADR